MTAHRFVDRDALDDADEAEDEASVDPFLSGGRRTLLPDLGPIIYRTDEKEPFDADVYRTPEGKNVGVIRLPSFGPDDLDEHVEAFATLIEKFEATTDALIIDQQNNPGGYFFYMMSLLSMLSPQPLKMPKQQEKITPQEVADADSTLQSLEKVTDAIVIASCGPAWARSSSALLAAAPRRNRERRAQRARASSGRAGCAQPVATKRS
jgi:hypothetical protein